MGATMGAALTGIGVIGAAVVFCGARGAAFGKGRFGGELATGGLVDGGGVELTSLVGGARLAGIGTGRATPNFVPDGGVDCFG